jgi:uncharacterized membrane protein HdeD (DUF308 family)
MVDQYVRPDRRDARATHPAADGRDTRAAHPAADGPTAREAADGPTAREAADGPTTRPAADRPTAGPAADRPTAHPAADRPVAGNASRWWLPAVLGIGSIVTGVALPVLPDAPLRVVVAVVGVALVFGGIGRLRSLGPAWAVLAPVVAIMWLLSGLLQLVIAVTVDGSATARLLALSGLSMLVGTGFAVWPGKPHT